ncbi:MAG TPA: class I SAM-dependent methyltransferase [Oleiagrimonas sp.]|nr:class I SAM-dependent methyltransferase [Oleiagrimonas sp.]
MTTSMPDFATIKQRQQAVWSAGDYAAIESRSVVVSENLCEAVDLRADQEVLDVACGSGNTSLAAARRNTMVTGIDYVPALLEYGRKRAAVERLDIRFQHGEAEALEFPEGSFDAVLSTFGAMFAPDQAKTASELLRVCRPGGKIGMANWAPDGFVGQGFRLVSSRMPPNPGLQPPSRWGTETGLREFFGDGVSKLSITRRDFVFRYRSAGHWLDYYRDNFGPVHTLFARLDEDAAKEFAGELITLCTSFNTADDGTLVIPSAYLEVVAVRR